MNQSIIHGIPVVLPDDWDDWSIFKFAVPAEKDPAGSRPVKGGAQPLQANVILARQPRVPNKKLEALLDDSNAAYSAQSPSFRLIAQGSANYLGNPAAWQDSSQTHGASGMLVYQRHVVIARSEDEVLLITMTGDRKDLDRISRSMAFDTQPSRAEADNQSREPRAPRKSDRAPAKKTRRR